MKVKFFKMEGLGNDFVFFGKQDEFVLRNTLRLVSDRRLGIGCDQILFYKEDLEKRIISLDIFNGDGSKAEVCGNGFRCAGVYFGEKNDWESFEILSKDKLYPVEYKESRSYVNFGSGLHKVLGGFEIDLVGIVGVHYVNVGNPHVVVFMDRDIQRLEVESVGSKIEKHKMFPRGVNVEFAKIIGNSEVVVQVWERGLGYSESCGSGACAVYEAGFRVGLFGGNLRVLMNHGVLDLKRNDKGDIILSGEVNYLYDGEYYLRGFK